MKTLLRRLSSLLVLLVAASGPCLLAQSGSPQQLVFAGLRSSGQQGQFNGVAVDAAGNLILLLNQKDGVRVLKTDPTATTVLAQALIGTTGDSGLAMTLDPAGNIYVTGTSTSGSLTGTSGAAFSYPVDTTDNAFVAKFDGSLNLVFTTFGGSGSTAVSAIAATADAVFITGLIYGNGLPVTPSGIIQAPAFGSTQNGFVEKFSADGKTLKYATYLSGQGGDTSPTVLAVDTKDNAYIAGFTTATGFPTVAALIPRAVGVTSGFLTELTPDGDGITFSTFIPGTGISSIAIDAASKTLLLSGTISLGQFPIASVAMPLVNTPYQVLVRMPLDGSAVLSSTVLAPGTQSYLALGPNGVVWVDGTLPTPLNPGSPLPLLPGTPLSNVGSGFAVRVSPVGTQGQTVVDLTARFGGLAAANPNNASVVATLTSLAVDSTGSAIFAGGMAPTASSSLLATQTFDLPLTNAPTAALPSLIHDAVLTPGSCNGSLCAGSAAYLARITPTAGASLALSTDAAPMLTLRNLGSAQATGVQIAATGFSTSSNCGATLNAGGECTILLGGTGPGTLTVTSANATSQTATLAALPAGGVSKGLVFYPKELDFGVQAATSPAQTKTITITNLSAQTQTFTSGLNGRAGFTPYTFAESASDCDLAGLLTNKQLAAGATCHVTLSFQASKDGTKDGPAQGNWMIGTGNVLLTGYGQAAALGLSATEIDFGTQFYGGLHVPRALYLSNSGSAAVAHTPVALPAKSPFTLTDNCPTQLAPQSVCQILFNYLSPVATSTDSTTLALDGGLSVLITGQTIPQPGTTGSSAPPSLIVTPTSITFPTAVLVTGVSGGTQTVTVQNTGTSAFALGLALTGDFTDQTSCGATLAAGASCTVILSFAPSQPGARQGLLGVTAGATAPVYVSLSGTGTPILPANNGTLDFGAVPVSQPAVQWYKVSQPFSTLTAGATPSSTFKVLLVEDTGSGHGSFPASSFLAATTGSCTNCWLGIQFTPPTAGPLTGSVSLLSALTGNPYTLGLTGVGLAPTGVSLSPLNNNFGPVDVNSASAPQLFTVTNLGTTATTLSAPVLTGDFQLSSAANGGTACTTTLAGSASCFLQVVFAPTAVGQRTGTLTLQAGTGSAAATVIGTGMADPGVAFSANNLIFTNVPGPAGTQQTLTVTNTGNVPLQIGAPTTGNAAFQATSTCGALAVAATCMVSVTFTPQNAVVTDTLQVPVTATIGGAPVTTPHSIGLAGNYTGVTAGLQITPTPVNYGPFPVNTVGSTRQFTVTNLSTKALTLVLPMPREFVLSGAPCTAIAASGSCTFSATFVPVTGGDITGSLVAQGIPADGSQTLSAIGYLQGFGSGTTTLTVTGALSTGVVLDFHQVASGQSATQTVTLTNTTSPSASPNTVTIRRVTSRWPYLATTTCGATLAPSQSCAVTVTYTPLNQVASGAVAPPVTTDTGVLTIESDAASSPNSVNLTGTSTATAVGSPSNAAPVPTFVPSQSSLTFPTTAVGFNSAAQSVTLSNTGTTVLHVTSLAATSDFVASGSCPAVLPGATCSFNVTFAPRVASQASGPRVGAVEIASDSSSSLEFISLLGDASPATLVFQPTSLTFGSVLVGGATTLPVKITNSGGTAAVFNGITATGDFSVAGDCPPSGGSLAASASCTVQVGFTPSVVGTRVGTLSVASSTSTNPLTVALQGTGVQAHLQVASALSFGNALVGSTVSLPLTLTNNGTTAITGITFAPAGDFAVTAPCATTILAAGATCSLTVAFTPTVVGARTGTLTIASSDPGSPAVVALTGTGTTGVVTPPSGGTFTLTVDGGASSTATITQTHSATYALSLTPLGGFTGQVALTCAPVASALAPNAACTILPTTVTLNGASQTATVTINTLTSAANLVPGFGERFDGVALCLLAPASFFFWRFRKLLPKHQRLTLLMALLCTSLVLLVSGCGSNNSSLRVTPPGSYQFTVTASSTTGTVVSQTVILKLVIN